MEVPDALGLDCPIRCATLHATVPARCCIVRQLAAARGRTLQGSRGQGSIFPSCDGCPQGAEVQAVTLGAEHLRWRGAGPGGRFDRGRGGVALQAAARRRLRLAGLLDPLPSLDEPPGEALAAVQ